MSNPHSTTISANVEVSWLRSVTAFSQGCVDSLPVCSTFLFLFFSLGAACLTAGFSPVQAVSMTLTVHAAPLQVYLAQHGKGLTVASILFAALVINFRFLIMSSVLAEQFKGVAPWKALLSAQLLSISTFTLSHNRKNESGNTYEYYLACGLSTLGTAMLALWWYRYSWRRCFFCSTVFASAVRGGISYSALFGNAYHHHWAAHFTDPIAASKLATLGLAVILAATYKGVFRTLSTCIAFSWS